MRRLLALVTAATVGGLVAAGAGTAAVSPQDQQFALAAQPAVKITVRENGWYSVSRKRLAAAGLNVAGDARLLQLYADGKQVPILVRGLEDRRLASNGSIEFYGQERNLRWTDARTYWLVSGSSPGERVTVAAALRARGLSRLHSFYYTSIHRDRLYYTEWSTRDRTHFYGSAVNPSTGPVDQTIAVQDIDQASRTAVLRVTIHGVSTLAHEVKVSLNGEVFPSIKFKGQKPASRSYIVPRELIKEGLNHVTLTAGAGELDFNLVDDLGLTYTRLLRARTGSLNFAVPDRRSARVAGFATKAVRLIDITNRAQPRFLVPAVARQDGTYGFVVGATDRRRRYLAVTPATIKRPAAVTANVPSAWHDEKRGADLLIITNRKYASALPPLVALREQDHLKVAVADVDDVYDEFSYGTHGPEAIKSFVAWTRQHWHPAPRFLLLVGGATVDPRHFLPNGEEDDVPTMLIHTTYMEAPSDVWFADSNSDGLPELSVGRLPVRTLDQAKTVVSKIVRYENTPPASHRALLVADAKPKEDFVTPTNQLRPLFPTSIGIDTAYRGEMTDAAVRKQLLAGLNGGPAIVNYFGHGAINLWSEGGMLQSSDAAGLHNAQSLSLYVMMTCINADFTYPGRLSLAEALLTRTDGGAVATIGSSSLTNGGVQPLHNQAFYKALFGNPGITVGQALDASRSATNDLDLRRSQMLFGDPTTHIHY